MKFLCALILLAVPAMQAYAASTESPCYRVDLAGWKPAMNLGGDEIFITPPKSIALTSKVTRIIDDRKEFAITTAPGATASVHERAYWYLDGEKIEMVWTNGYSGLRMELTSTQKGLSGIANTFWDFDRPTQSSLVSLHEIPCS